QAERKGAFSERAWADENSAHSIWIKFVDRRVTSSSGVQIARAVKSQAKPITRDGAEDASAYAWYELVDRAVPHHINIASRICGDASKEILTHVANGSDPVKHVEFHQSPNSRSPTTVRNDGFSHEQIADAVKGQPSRKT